MAERKPKSEPEGDEKRTPSIYVNDKGETCIGSECFVLRLPEDEDGEIALDFDESRCGDEERGAIRRVKERLIDGAVTRYNFEKAPARKK